MRHLFLAALVTLGISSSSFADDANVVAVVNGEQITAQRLDELWSSLSPKMAAQYEEVGGKTALLDNYIRKRLILQDAARNGFEGAAEQLSLKEESELFNRYVRQHFGSKIVTDEDVAAYYTANPDRFRHLDQALVRQILISTKDTSVESAREKLGTIMSELHHKRTTLRGRDEAFIEEFANAAARYSEDAASAKKGGSLGWRERLRLDPVLADAAFTVAPGNMSGILETEQGLHLLLVEARREAGIEKLERAAGPIRDTLISKRAPDIIKAVNARTDELMEAGEVTIYVENIQ